MDELKSNGVPMEDKAFLENDNFEMTDARIEKQAAWMENYLDALEELDDV